jgi:hypothetical protein
MRAIVFTIAICCLWLAEAQQWTTDSTFSIPSPGYSMAAGTTANNGHFYVSGQSASTASVYNKVTDQWTILHLPVTDTWEILKPLGNLVIFVGRSQILLYNTVTGQFTSKSSIATFRCATVTGDYFVSAGGYTNVPSEALDLVEIYDVSSSLWSTATLPLARSQCGATAVGAKVYIAGGADNTNTAVNNLDVYDTVSNTWASSTLPAARVGVSMVAVGTTIFIGSNSASTISIYQTVGNSWDSRALGYTPSGATPSTVLGTKAIFVSGSSSGFDYSIFDTTTTVWTSGSVAVGTWSSMGVSDFGTQALVFGGSRASTMYSYNRPSLDACDVDGDCGHGLCISSTTAKGCSCFSGFGGATCNTRPDASCNYQAVDNNLADLDGDISLRIADSTVYLVVKANLEQTLYVTPSLNDVTGTGPHSLGTQVIFGNACDYPSTTVGPSWTRVAATVGSCADTVLYSIPWSYAVSKCGFTAAAETATFSKSVTISRKYQLADLGNGVPLYRTISSTQNLGVVFPTSVDVNTSTAVTSRVVTSYAIVSFVFDPSLGNWLVSVATYTTLPYKLSNPQLSATTTASLDTRYVLGSLAITGTCGDNANSCLQTINYQLSGCEALSGNVIITTTPVCSGGLNEDCTTVSDTVTITTSVSAGATCGIVNNIQFSVVKLNSFSTSSLSVTKTQFAFSDVAYFGGDIESTNATISAFTVQSVCMIYNGGPCTTVQYTVLPDVGQNRPVFSVNLTQTKLFTPSTSAHTFTIKATIAVAWSNSKRTLQLARVNIGSSIDVDPAVSITTGESVDTSSGSVVYSSLFFVMVLSLLLAL